MITQLQTPSSMPGKPPPQDGAGSTGRLIQPVRVTYASSWMHFLIVLCLIVAWYFPLRALVSHWLYPKVELGPRNSYSFVAISYDGVSKRTNEVSPALFTEHLNTLRARGYVPIGLDDVRQLVYEGKPVPSKAVLLTFDHGRKTSYFAVDSVLKSAGWKAVMFLWTHPIVDKDSAALLWPYIRIMAGSGTWELGAQSNNGFAAVPASQRGYLGHFMTTAKWLSDENRFESPTEFANRLMQDHEECLQIIQKKVGIKPIAYAYPYGDFGQFESRAVFARRVNLQLVSKYYNLGFLAGNLPLNTRYSDPKRLNRLRVKPEWSGDDLADFLDRSWPVEETASSTNASRIAAAWIVDWGGMKEEKGRMTLYAPEQNTGAKMWLAGSDLTMDFYSRVIFSDLNGQLGIYARAAADEESFVYFGLDSKGSIWLRQTKFGRDTTRLEDEQNLDMGVWLRQKHVSLERFTLASTHVTVDPTKEHVLDIFARGSLMFARLDGHNIFSERVLLRGDTKPGMMGLSVWNADKGRARVTISEITLKRQESTVATWNSTASPRDANAFRWIHQNAYALTDLSPSWISFSPAGQMIKAAWDPFAYLMLARMYHFNLMPQVNINDERALSRLAPSQLADKLGEIKSQGLFVTMDEIQNAAAPRITSWLQQCAADLRARGLDLMVRLPASLETPAFVRSLVAVAPSLQVVASSTSSLRAATTKGTNVPTAKLEPVPEADQDKDMPVFYELNAVPDMQGTPSSAVQLSRMQQEGQAAFLDADYNKAISLWRQWAAGEPSNPRAPALLGDAYLRLGDLKQALSNYDASLALDPGQVRLALRRAGLLDNLGRAEESMNGLNMYARLFPENSDIMLAQAEWLRRHDRDAEAIPIVRHVIQQDTNNFEAIALMLRLPIPPADAQAQMNSLLRLGTQPEFNYDLGQAIWKYDLLSTSGSHALAKLIRDTATHTKDARVAALFERLLPRNNQVVDTFAGGHISDAWWLDGGVFNAETSKLQIHSDDNHTEASMRLLGSDHFRDAYVEAVIQHKTGAFWLYARRTSGHMLRFGIDEANKIFLQLWRGNHIVDQRSKQGAELKNATRLRLEVRGDGVMAYVDNQLVFSTPLELPRDFELGWLGMAAFNSDRGKALAILSYAAAGPLAPRLLLLPTLPNDSAVDAALLNIRPDINRLTDLAPAWFHVANDGVWQPAIGGDEQLLRLFARYYRIRLMPAITLDGATVLRAEDLINTAAKHNLDGFVLVFPSMPDNAWFENLERGLSAANLKLLAVSVDLGKPTCQIRGVAAGADLLSANAGSNQEALLLPWLDGSGAHKPLGDLPTLKPAVLKM